MFFIFWYLFFHILIFWFLVLTIALYQKRFPQWGWNRIVHQLYDRMIDNIIIFLTFMFHIRVCFIFLSVNLFAVLSRSILGKKMTNSRLTWRFMKICIILSVNVCFCLYEFVWDAGRENEIENRVTYVMQRFSCSVMTTYGAMCVCNKFHKNITVDSTCICCQWVKGLIKIHICDFLLSFRY